ncbi:hypothetical protein [Gorillibacterium sp. sgz5001074]|uniref:hypothetical protein n=1 Tax=Gorillibacterium sp. sgz5001074 TaxID=3446695 RepID=UPI003F6672F2
MFPDIIQVVAEDVAEGLLNRLEQNWRDFIVEDGFSRSAAEAAFESELEQIGFDLEILPDEDYREILNHPVVQGAIEEMQIQAEEAAADDMDRFDAFHTGSMEKQLRYHGMSIRDFV